MRMRDALAAIGTILLAGIAWADTHTVAVMIEGLDEEAQGIVVAALSREGHTVLDKEYLDRVRRELNVMDRELFNEEDVAGQVGRRLSEDYQADLMIVGRVEASPPRVALDGTNEVTVEVRIIFKVRATTGARILAQGAATGKARARNRREAALQAHREAAMEMVPKLRISDRAPSQVRFFLRRLPEGEEQNRVITTVLRFLSERDDIAIVGEPVTDRPNREWRSSFRTNTPTYLIDLAFREYVDELPEFALLSVASMQRGELAYYLAEERDADYVIALEGLPSEERFTTANRFVQLLEAIEGVERVSSRYEGALERMILYLWVQKSLRGRLEALAERIVDRLRAEGLDRRIRLEKSGPEELVFSLKSEAQLFRLELSNLPPARYHEQGWRIVEVLGNLDGVRDLHAAYDQPAETLRIRLQYPEALFYLERALWERLRQEPGFEDLQMGRSDQGTVRYYLAGREGEASVVVVRVLNVPRERFKETMFELEELIRGIAGVQEANVTRKGAEATEEVRVRFEGTASQLDAAILARAREKESLATLAPGDFLGNVLTYLFLNEPNEEIRIFVRLLDLEPVRYSAAGPAFIQLIKAIAGVTREPVHKWYPRRHMLELDVRFRGLPHQLDSAIWEALQAEDGEGLRRLAGEGATIVPGMLAGNVLEYWIVPVEERSAGGPRRPGQPMPPIGPRPTTGAGAPGPGAELAQEALRGTAVIQVETPKGTVLGAGFFVSERGHLLTNAHVVSPSQEVSAIRVLAADGRSFKATVVDQNDKIDVALVVVQPPPAAAPFYPLPIGNSNSLQVGSRLLIVGHPHGAEFSVTTGIVSALDRERGRLQTDATLHPGSSGGPVLNEHGEVVGISVSVALERQTAGGTELLIRQAGMSYIVPINLARNLLDLIGD